MSTSLQQEVKQQLVVDETETNDLEEEITCAVCQEHFEDPKILPCCHYYCLRCVQLLIDTAASKDKDFFSCPECRTDTKVSENDPHKLPTAFFVNRMKALYSKREKTTGKVKVECEQCSVQEAIAFCRQCAEFICEKCNEAHKRMKAFSSHRVSTLEELRGRSSKQLPPEKLPSPSACSVHDEPVKLYCYNCECLICRDCIVIDHKAHKYEFVKRVAPEVKDKLVQDLAPLKKVYTTVTNAMKAVEVTKSEVEGSGKKITATIQKSFQRLHDIIEHRKQEVLRQASKIVDTKFDRLGTQVKELQATASAIKGILELVEQGVENMTDEEVIAIHGQILKQIGEAKKKHENLSLDLKPVEEADVTFYMNCVDELKQLCQGNIKVFANTNRKVVWVDPKVNNRENSSYVRYLKTVEGVSLHATTSASEALSVLLEADPSVEYRAVTAGTGGKEFIEKLRAKGMHCPVLVFCASYDWHSKWARKFKDVQVTVDPSEMFEFATWQGH